MRTDYVQIEEAYNNLIPVLIKIASKLEEQLLTYFEGIAHIDRVICRVKNVDSFMAKTEKLDDFKKLKYTVPLKEIQDMIGARIVVYYKTDIPAAKDIVNRYFKRVEQKFLKPEDVTKFGYEGFHMVCSIPTTVYPPPEVNLFADFFEVQIKTLYQHAWSQSNHGLGYKPGQTLTHDDERMLAFIAAQSWGADKALCDLAIKHE